MSESVTMKEIDNSPKQKSKEDIESENESLISAISNNNEVKMEKKVDPEKLAALKAKMAERAKEESIISAPVERSVSIKMGEIGRAHV